MVRINEKKLKVPLDEIDLITITLFSDFKDDYLPIINTNFTFNESLIPLVNSLFHVKPTLYYNKNYYGNNITTTIKKPLSHLLHLINKSSSIGDGGDGRDGDGGDNARKYPSFLYDVITSSFILKSNDTCTIETYNKKILATYLEDNQLIRVYHNKLHNKNNNNDNIVDFTSDIIHEEESNQIIWQLDEWMTFEITILTLSTTNNTKSNTKNNTKNNINESRCKYEFVINVIENNKFITSRLERINEILSLFDKIKSSFILNKDNKNDITN